MGPARGRVGAGGAGFSGSAPAELLDLDWTRFGSRVAGTFLGAVGVGAPGGLGAGLGQAGSGLSHPPGMAPPGSPEPSRGRPPSTVLLHPPGRPTLPFPARRPLPWPAVPVVWLWPMAVPALRSGKSLAPGPLHPLPGSSQRVPMAWHGPQRSARALGPAGTHRPFLLTERHPVGHGGLLGFPPPTPLWPPSLSAESPSVWEAPWAKPGGEAG